MAGNIFKDSGNRESDERKKHEHVNLLISRYFAKYDDKIKQTIRKYAFRNDGFTQLFKKIATPMPTGLQSQIEAILRYLTVFGEEDFRKKVLFSGEEYQLKITPIFHARQSDNCFLIDSPPVKEPETVKEPEPIKTETKISAELDPYTKAVNEAQAKFQSEKMPAWPGSAQSTSVTQPVKLPDETKEQSPDFTAKIKSPPEEEKTTGKTPDVKSWPDIDRRTNGERRKLRSRRREVDLIFKNKRFGGERRSGLDRRKGKK